MNVLMVGSDGNAVTEGSPLARRLTAYAAHLDTLHVLLLGRGRRGDDVTLPPNVFVHDLRSRLGLVSFLRGTGRARQLIKAHGIAVVSAQNPFEHGFIAMRAVRGTTAKLHLQVHTDYLSPWFTRGAIYRSPRVRMPLLNRIRIPLAHRVVIRADGIRAVSARIKESMLARYGARIPEPSVIPIPMSPEVPPKVSLPERPFTFTLIAVSRLEPEKRLPDVLATVRRLHQVYPSLGVVIVGDGSERTHLEKLARTWGIEDRVLFLGWRPDAWGLIQDANAFIQASAYEGYGATLIEAALAGVPIVTSDVGVVGEVFVGYEHVFAAPVGDPTNLAALTAQLIEDPQTRILLSLEGKRAALAHLAALKNTPADIVADMLRTVSP
ncbi:MAG TPA: glycosyltransferase [Candidatus Paceibacterota bacterium]